MQLLTPVSEQKFLPTFLGFFYLASCQRISSTSGRQIRDASEFKKKKHLKNESQVSIVG